MDCSINGLASRRLRPLGHASDARVFRERTERVPRSAARLGATSLIHDVAHRDGWDWSDDTHLEVTFHGATCDQVRGASGGEVLAAVFGCPAAVPP